MAADKMSSEQQACDFKFQTFFCDLYKLKTTVCFDVITERNTIDTALFHS